MSRATFAVRVLATSMSTLLACGEPPPPSAGSFTDAGAYPPRGEAPLPDALSPVDDEVRLEEVPASPCVATTSARARPITTGGRYLTDLDVVGGHFVARSVTGDGLLLFDRSGASPRTVTLGTDTRGAASVSGLLVAGVDPATSILSAQAMSETGEALGPAQPLGPLRPGRPFAVARSGAQGLAVWAAPSFDVRARVLDDRGHAGPVVLLESGADFDDLSVVAAGSTSASDTGEFLVVWALRRVALSGYRVYAARIGQGGLVGKSRLVLASEVRIALTRLVSFADGEVLLANRDGEPLVVPLDLVGRPRDLATLYRGARDATIGGGQGLSHDAGGLGLIVAHESGAHALRVLGRDGRAESGWVCLDAPDPDGFHLGSIASDIGGWTVLLAAPGGTGLLEVDRSGTSAR